MYQYLALTSLRDSHPLPTRHIRELGTDRRLFFSLPYFCFRTLVSISVFSTVTCPWCAVHPTLCNDFFCNYLHSCHWSCSELYGSHSGWSANSADILMGPTTASWQEWYHHWLPALLWSPAQYLPKSVQPVGPSEHHYHSECVHSWNYLHLSSVAW